MSAGHEATMPLIQLPTNPKIHKGRFDFLVQLAKGKRVLHLGCVDEGLVEARLAAGTHLHARLAQVATEIWGVDIDSAGLTALRNHGFRNLVEFDVTANGLAEVIGNQQFDLIIASELVEHLSNPGRFLESVRLLFQSNTAMVVTTPNARRLSGLEYELAGYEPSNPDHVSAYSFATLQRLCLRHGYTIQGVGVYVGAEMTQPSLTRAWRALRRHRQRSADSQNGAIPGQTLSVRRSSLGLLLRELGRRLLLPHHPFLADGLVLEIRPSDVNQPRDQGTA